MLTSHHISIYVFYVWVVYIVFGCNARNYIKEKGGISRTAQEKQTRKTQIYTLLMHISLIGLPDLPQKPDSYKTYPPKSKNI